MADCRNWQHTQYTPSFKGVSFFVEEDTFNGGRNAVTHEYPGSEFWDVEDMGRRPQPVQVSGYVKGDDADQQAHLLVMACSSFGPGLLFLPVRPPVVCTCLHASSTFVANELGRIYVEMEFMRDAGGIGGMISVVMLGGAVSLSVGIGEAGVMASFSLNFDSVLRRFSPLSYVPAVARDAASRTISLASRALNMVRLASKMSDVKDASTAEMLIRTMIRNAVVLAYQGQRGNRIEAEVFVADQENIQNGFASSFQEVLALIAKTADPLALSQVLLDLMDFERQHINTSIDTLSVRAEVALCDEVVRLVKRLALLRWAEAMTRIAYVSRRDAVNARSMLSEKFELLMQDVTEDSTRNAMLDARNAAVQLLSQTGAELPQVVSIKLGRPLPAAVLAAQLYKNADRGAELIARNNIEHPFYSPLHLEALAPANNGI